LKEKLEMLTEAPDDTAEQKKDLEKEITRLESETLEERTQRKKEEDRKKEEAATVTKAERDRKRAEKEAEKEAQRVAEAAAKAATMAAVRDAKWSAEDDATIVKMIADDVPCSKIASELGNGRSQNDIRNRWHRYLKELSGIIKPPGKKGPRSRITWTADIDETIVSMKEGGSNFAKIASELGNGLKRNDTQNRWNCHLKTN
jgi:hypothetical protein